MNLHLCNVLYKKSYSAARRVALRESVLCLHLRCYCNNCPLFLQEYDHQTIKPFSWTFEYPIWIEKKQDNIKSQNVWNSTLRMTITNLLNYTDKQWPFQTVWGVREAGRVLLGFPKFKIASFWLTNSFGCRTADLSLDYLTGQERSSTSR